MYIRYSHSFCYDNTCVRKPHCGALRQTMLWISKELNRSELVDPAHSSYVHASITYQVNIPIHLINESDPLNCNFHSLEAVSRWRDAKLQVSKNYSDLIERRSTISNFFLLLSRFIFIKKAGILCANKKWKTNVIRTAIERLIWI